MTVGIPGAKLWVEDTGGRGPAVVLLHARTGCAAMWRSQLAAFSAAGYRCIAYDRRDSGRSEIAPGAAPAIPSDDTHALLDILQVGKCHLVGTAAGGIVALDFALSHPERLLSLVFANSVGSAEIKQEPEYAAIAGHLRPEAHLPPEVRELSEAYRTRNPRGTQEWLQLAEETGRKKPPFPSTRQPIPLARLREVRVPVLLVTGEVDPYTPPAMLEVFARYFPKPHSVVLPGCSHSAFWEEPERFNRAVLAFFSGGAAS